MYMYTSLYICIYAYIYVCIHAHIYIYIHVYIYTYIYIYVCTYVCIYTCIHIEQEIRVFPAVHAGFPFRVLHSAYRHDWALFCRLANKPRLWDDSGRLTSVGCVIPSFRPIDRPTTRPTNRRTDRPPDRPTDRPTVQPTRKPRRSIISATGPLVAPVISPSCQVWHVCTFLYILVLTLSNDWILF